MFVWVLWTSETTTTEQMPQGDNTLPSGYTDDSTFIPFLKANDSLPGTFPGLKSMSFIKNLQPNTLASSTICAAIKKPKGIRPGYEDCESINGSPQEHKISLWTSTACY